MLIVLLLFESLVVPISAKVEMKGVDCDDGYLDCSARSGSCVADNYPELLQMMTHCRKTCRQYLENKVWIRTKIRNREY